MMSSLSSSLVAKADERGAPLFVRWLLSLLLLFVCAGCGSSHALHPVAPDTARKSLETVLEGWKAGKSPDAWRGEKPEIVVQDVDWSMGKKLVAYEIVGEGKAVDANLHCDVKLELAEGAGTTSRTVHYLVGTSPVITVFRQIVP